LEFCVEWRRRGLDWCGLLLRARDGSKGRAGYAEAKCKSDQICLLVGEHSGQFPEPGRGWHRGLTIQEGSSDVNRELATRRVVLETEGRQSRILLRRSQVFSFIYALAFNPVTRESTSKLIRRVPLSLDAVILAFVPV